MEVSNRRSGILTKRTARRKERFIEDE